MCATVGWNIPRASVMDITPSGWGEGGSIGATGQSLPLVRLQLPVPQPLLRLQVDSSGSHMLAAARGSLGESGESLTKDLYRNRHMSHSGVLLSIDG